MKKLTVVDLFSGCGGFSQGFVDAGYEALVGVDCVQDALDTYAFNIKGSSALNLDLFEQSSFIKIKEELKGVSLDVLIGGPPCQGFSLAGARDSEDERNSLYEAMFAVAKLTGPKVIVIENVPGFVNMYGGVAKEEVLARCEEMGYSCEYKVLYAPDYGVPQIRKRAFFVAVRKDLGKFSFPSASCSPDNYVTCKQAIGDLNLLKDKKSHDEYNRGKASNYQTAMRGDNNKGVKNHVRTEHKKHVIEVIRQVGAGQNYKCLEPGVGSSRTFNEAWTRYHPDKPSRTIDTGHGNHFHYKAHRVPTVRENARLQSFPDKFEFLGSKTSQGRQVGNAVPPLLAKAIAVKIREHLNG